MRRINSTPIVDWLSSKKLTFACSNLTVNKLFHIVLPQYELAISIILWYYIGVVVVKTALSVRLSV